MGLRPVQNPPNPFQKQHREVLGEIPEVRFAVYEDDSRSILSHNESPDIPFRWSINPYRGCSHACIYCYARPSHEYLGFGAGTDFDTQLTIKRQAAALLRKAFDAPSWTGERIQFSGITDCYQPIEAVYELTRQCLQVCLEYKNPVGIITKAALIERDIDLLTQLREQAEVDIAISFPFIDPELARKIEPGAPSPQRRLKTIQRLRAAGLPVGVMIAPLIPGLNDSEMPKILEATKEAGAQWADFLLLRLPGSVEAVFEQSLRQVWPERADKVLNQLYEMRGGEPGENRVGMRMRGQGTRYQAVRDLFKILRRRHGLDQDASRPTPKTFKRPLRAGDQLSLFDV